MSGVLEFSGVAENREPWILGSFDQLKVARRLESEFPTLEEAGCRIGVATGADRVYIGPYDNLEVEPDRKLPLVTTRDIQSGTVKWRRLGVVNPFRDDGSLVDLADYPKLARYLERHEEKIRARNCAKKNPKGWYRTIDRIHPGLTTRPKFLIPDLKGEPHVVYEDGKLYPHYNLYFITSEEWDLKALRAVLRSGIAKLFVSIYSTQMRGRLPPLPGPVPAPYPSPALPSGTVPLTSQYSMSTQERLTPTGTTSSARSLSRNSYTRRPPCSYLRAPP